MDNAKADTESHLLPLQQWAIVRDAYKKAGHKRLFRDVFCNRGKIRASQIALWIIIGLFCIISVISVLIIIPPIIAFAKILIVLLVIAFVLVFEYTLKDTYSEYYKDSYYKMLIKDYRKDRLFIRYLLFKESLKNNPGYSKINMETIQHFIDAELQMVKGSVLSNHPFIVPLIGMITVIVGGGASIKEGWTAGVTPFLFIVLVVILFYSILLTEGFKGKKNKLYELKQFIFWLEQDKERRIDNTSYIKP